MQKFGMAQTVDAIALKAFTITASLCLLFFHRYSFIAIISIFWIFRRFYPNFCPLHLKFYLFVDNNPQAASMSWPREALIVAIMPLSFNLSRKRTISSIEGL